MLSFKCSWNWGKFKIVDKEVLDLDLKSHGFSEAKWLFKQKIFARVHQKKIESSSKEYGTWKPFKIWPI